MRFTSTERLARASARRPWLVIGIWIVLLLAGGYLASGIGDVLTQSFSLTSKPESQRADDLLQARLRGPKQAQESVLISSPSLTVDDPAFRSEAEGLISDLRGLSATVKDATSYYETNAPSLVSSDKHTLLVPVDILGDYGEAADNVKPLLEGRRRSERAGRIPGAHRRRGQHRQRLQRGLIARTPRRASASASRSPSIILLLVFGAAVAAGIPLLMAIVSIVVAFGIAALIGQAYELSFLLTNIVPMIGLAVGIDYTLLIVQRFREERAHGLEKMDAIGMAGATAEPHRAVLRQHRRSSVCSG